MIDRALPAFFILLFATFSAAAEPAKVSMKWEQLAVAVAGKTVTTEMKDTSRLKATVDSVDPSGMAVRVRHKGMQHIPRESIGSILLAHNHIRGRVAGTVVGLAVGLGAAFAIEWNHGIFSTPSPGVDVAAVAVLAAGPLGGYFLGRLADRRDVRIVVVP